MKKSKTGMSGHTNHKQVAPKHPLAKQAVKTTKSAGPTKSSSLVHKHMTMKKSSSPKKAK